MMEERKFQALRSEKKAVFLPKTNIENHGAPGGHGKRRHVAQAIVISTLLFIWWSSSAMPEFPGLGRQDELMDGHGTELVDFDDIIPSEKLEWHPCYSYDPPLKCARLTVPMDYHRPLNESENNPKVHVALVLVPGKHNGPKNFSLSPLLLNPGGPGGSGVQFAIGIADRIHKLVGEEQDVIGFDPRGIGATTPRADCFSYPLEGFAIGSNSTSREEDYVGGSFHRFLWLLEGQGVGIVNSSSRSLQMIDARARSLAKLCQEKDSLNGKDSILKHLHTPSVARDILSIVDAWDEWTDGLSSKTEDSPGALEENPNNVTEPELTRSLDTKGKLVYWGFSYGTLLGATFASMFPNRVGRMILDGVVDADHYVGPVWTDSIRDADTVFDSFPKYCHEAKEVCALYRDGDKVTDVQKRFLGILNNLKDNPITGVSKWSKTPYIITYSTIKTLLFLTLYAPTALFPVIATIFELILKGDLGTNVGTLTIPNMYDLKQLCGAPLPAREYPNEAPPAIMCSDKRYPLNETLLNLEIRFQEMSNLSSFADVWLTLMLGCEGWGIEAIDPPMRWDDHPTHKPKPIKTSYPILFISNTADPVTPLWAGVQMAKKFVDAGLIEQKSEGHCSLAAVSRCTIGKIQAYFNTGDVSPPPVEGGKGRELVDGKWDRCEADEWPFHPYDGEEYIAMMGVDTTEEAERMTALKDMQNAFKEMKFWGQQGI